MVQKLKQEEHYRIKVSIIGEKDSWTVGLWSGKQFLTIRPYNKVLEVGEQIPSNEELKMIRADIESNSRDQPKGYYE